MLPAATEGQALGRDKSTQQLLKENDRSVNAGSILAVNLDSRRNRRRQSGTHHLSIAPRAF